METEKYHSSLAKMFAASVCTEAVHYQFRTHARVGAVLSGQESSPWGLVMPETIQECVHRYSRWNKSSTYP